MDMKLKKKLLFMFDFYAFLPLVCLILMFCIISGEPSPLIIIPIIGFAIWVLALIIGPIIALSKGTKVARQKQLAGAKLQKRPDHTVYQANTVIFEQLKIRRKKMILLILGLATIPTFLLGILLSAITDFEAAWIVLIFLLLLFVGFHVFLLYWFHEEETKYKYFPGCPDQFRHEVSVEFDLNTPGKVLCKFTLPGYHTEQLKELKGVYYNTTTKILVCMWGEIRQRNSGRGVQQDSLIITLSQPQSEELYCLLKENGVQNIQELSISNGTYIAKAINEK